jgi:hypothetical protein
VEGFLISIPILLLSEKLDVFHSLRATLKVQISIRATKGRQKKSVALIVKCWHGMS